MKILKPDWINHNGMPICSIDIHPDGSRVATGGQGEDSGRIVIWNMAPVISEAKEVDEHVPRMLCQLDNHLACVNCVRWSSSGKYLASGGDDKLVMVWTISKSSGGNSVFGGKGKVNLEGWRCVFTLRGHQGDVLDMAWSPNDHWLATCSVDNTVIVWRSDNLPEVVTVLKGHTGLVKGVSWDPVGKYLSSQSDDKSVRIWRTCDWHQEAVIKDPFEKCAGTTLVLRLSWSPDGQYLVTAHAMNGAVPTAQIIDRDGWGHDKDFVGHHMAITCVRFSGFIMECERKGKASRACVCAIGSRDRSVSVWLTSLTRPVVVMEDLFTSPVLDLSWGPGGQSFMACSGDGTTAYLEFSKHEIGFPITDTDKGLLFEKLYGKADIGENEGGMVVVENPEVLTPTATASVMGPSPPVQNNSTISPPTPRSSCPPTNRQIETRAADGRRRITPVYIPPAPDTGEEVVPFGSDSMSFSSTCVSNKSRIVVEKRNDVIVQPNVTAAPNSTVTPKREEVHPPPRIQPPPRPQPLPSPPAEGGFSSLVESTEKAEIKRKKPSVVTLRNVGAKFKKGAECERCPVPCGGASTSSQQFLPALTLPTSATIKVAGSRKVVHIQNRVNRGPYGNLTSVKCSCPEEPKPKWEIMLGNEVTCCCGGCGLVGLGCADGTLHLMSSEDGSRLVPPLVLTAPLALLTLSQAHLVVVTTDAQVTLWRLPELRPVISASNISFLVLSPDGGMVKIKECFVSNEGEPMLALSTGKAYVYSLKYLTWMLVGNSSDAVARNAFQSYKGSIRNTTTPTSLSLPLKTIQAAAFNGVNVGSSRVLPGSDIGPACTLSYLDTQLSCATALSSAQEYRFWLLTLVRFLLHQGMEGRLRRICEDLLGPSHSSSSASHTWQKEILGIGKHSLLREILSEMSSNLRSQRLYLEFRNQLDNSV